MAKQTWVKDNGTWKKAKSAWVNVNGQWKEDVMPKGVVSGSWKEFMEYGYLVFSVHRPRNTSFRKRNTSDLAIGNTQTIFQRTFSTTNIPSHTYPRTIDVFPPNENSYIGTSNGNHIYKINSGGDVIWQVSAIGHQPAPQVMAINKYEELMVPGSSSVRKLSPEGTLTTLRARVTNDTHRRKYNVDYKGDFYILDVVTIYKYNRDRSLVYSIMATNSGSTPRINFTIDHLGNIYAAADNSSSQTFTRFDNEGNVLYRRGDKRFTRLVDVQADKDYVYVLETTELHKVFRGTGNIVSTITLPREAYGGFANGRLRVTKDGYFIYTYDTQSGYVMIDSEGNELATWGDYSSDLSHGLVGAFPENW